MGLRVVAVTTREWTISTSVSSIAVCVHRWCHGGYQHMARTQPLCCTMRRLRERRRKKAKRGKEREVCVYFVDVCVGV